MVLKIRLARFGVKHKPFYNIVVAHARTARNSKPLEVIGTYDPIPKLPPTYDPSLPATEASQPRRYKDIQLDTSRAKYWLGVGAQPSDPVWRLLGMVGLIEPKPGQKRWQRLRTDKAEVEVEEEVEAAAEAVKEKGMGKGDG